MPTRIPKIHYFDHDEMSLCGRELTEKMLTRVPEEVTCGKCNQTLQKIDGRWCIKVKYYDSCSGCFESQDGQPVGLYLIHPKHKCYKGNGCKECAGHGVKLMEAWVPIGEAK